jgi:hypothetical protein
MALDNEALLDRVSPKSNRIAWISFINLIVLFSFHSLTPNQDSKNTNYTLERNGQVDLGLG